MHGRDRLAGLPELVDHVAHALDVLEEQLRRVVEVDVRLRGAVDDELEAAGDEPVCLDHGRVTARRQSDAGVVGLSLRHASSLPLRPSEDIGLRRPVGVDAARERIPAGRNTT